MKTNVPFVLRGTITLVVLAVFVFFTADNRWDVLFRTWLIYPLALLVSWFTAGFMYDLFLTKRVVKATPTALRDTRTVEPGASSLRSRAIGYYVMQVFILALILLFTIAKHAEYRGMVKAERYWQQKNNAQ